MVFEIDGTDITPYIHFEGLKYTTFDLDSEETTRTLDGNLRRSRIATKVRWDVPCKLLRTKEVDAASQARVGTASSIGPCVRSSCGYVLLQQQFYFDEDYQQNF